MREDGLLFTLVVIASLLDPHAAAGAAFGCCFHLSIPKRSNEGRFLLPMVSLGFGYSVGISFGGDNTMIAAIVAAALGSGALSVGKSMIIALRSAILDGEDAPLWLKYIVDSVLRTKP